MNAPVFVPNVNAAVFVPTFSAPPPQPQPPSPEPAQERESDGAAHFVQTDLVLAPKHLEVILTAPCPNYTSRRLVSI